MPFLSSVKIDHAEEVEETEASCIMDEIRNDATSQLILMLQISRDDASTLANASLEKLQIGQGAENQKVAFVESVIDDAMASYFDSTSKSRTPQELDEDYEHSKDSFEGTKNNDHPILFQNDRINRKRKNDSTESSSSTKKTANSTASTRPKTLREYFSSNSPKTSQTSLNIERSPLKSKVTSTSFLRSSKGLSESRIFSYLTSNFPKSDELMKSNDVDDDDDDDDVVIIESERQLNDDNKPESNEIFNRFSTKQSDFTSAEDSSKLSNDTNQKSKSQNILKSSNESTPSNYKHEDGGNANDSCDIEPNFGQSEFNAIQLSQNYHANTNKHPKQADSSPPFLHLCKALSAVCATTKRLQKEHILTDLFLTLLYFDRTKNDTDKIKHGEKQTVQLMSAALQSLLICGDVVLHGFALNIGHSIISQSLCLALSCSPSTLKQRINITGEMGDAAASIFKGESNGSAKSTKKQLKQTRLKWNTSKPKALQIMDIIQCICLLDSINKEGGKGIENRKKEILRNLFSSVQHVEEIRFAVKILCNNLRTGATLITAMRCFAAAHILQIHNVTNAYQYDSRGKLRQNSKSPKPCISDYKEKINEFQELLRIVYAKHHNLKSCIQTLVWDGGKCLSNCNVEALIPVQPLLASPSRSIDEVIEHYKKYWRENIQPQKCFEKVPNIAAEYKYDGQRAQIHYKKGTKNSTEVKIYSRHLDEITTKFESVVMWLLEYNWPIHINSFVIDTEIVAVERSENGLISILPFQVLSTLKRDKVSTNTEGMIINDSKPCSDSVSLCIFAFDLLYFNGLPLIHETLFERRKILHNFFEPTVRPGYFQFAKSIDLCFENDDASSLYTKLETFLMESIGPGKCEGLMLKSLQSKYSSWETREKSGGNGGWRKLKKVTLENINLWVGCSSFPLEITDIRSQIFNFVIYLKDYVDALADSFDVVPIGAWRGNGRKSKWFSPFLFVCL